MGPIPFEVHGLPPKKHGKNGSMWGNEGEAKKLIALRKKAFDELGSQPLTGKIRLTLTVHAGVKDFDKLDRDARAKAVKNVGDLDNFVAGVCDGLMAADPNLLRAKTWHEDFDRENAEVHPSNAIAYEDDSQVMEINAKKCIGPGKHRWYKIDLEEVEGE